MQLGGTKMVKRELESLAIYEISEDADTLPMACLYNLYKEKPSETIYIVKQGKLYGIVCMGEVIYGDKRNEIVKINKSFTMLEEYNIVKAHEIFANRENIYKIPVIGKQGQLLGDYSRWDDVLYIERNHLRLMQEFIIKKLLHQYKAVYVIEPAENDYPQYLGLCTYLEKFQIRYVVISKEEFGEKRAERAISIFLSEDERRATQCLYGIVPRKYNVQGYNNFRFDWTEDAEWNIRMATYRSILEQVEEEIQLKQLHIEKPMELLYGNIDEKMTIFLSELQKRGMKCFHICEYNEVEKLTDYEENFRKEIYERNITKPVDLKHPWPQNKEFYGELYQQEDYRDNIAQEEIWNAWRTFEYVKKITGKYFNAKDGKRKTCFQPEKYIGTIYILGACTATGAWEEDSHTIESFLQKILLKKGYAYRVENYGTRICFPMLENRMKEIDKFYKNDILVIIGVKRVMGIPEKSAEKIFEQYRMPTKWVTNMYVHSNWKANKIIAEDLLEELKPYLTDSKVENREELHINLNDIMRDYIQHKYLDVYFGDFVVENYEKIGAVVINCNPFTKGHRYLIEQARQQVEFLIIFVVEEDASLFSFEERFKMAVDATKDLSNVMVVPSGSFILSEDNFPEYFSHRNGELDVLHAEYDITIFADYIAKELHITHRFAGKETSDKVKMIYNDAMKKILTQRRISFIEIPKMMVNDEEITGYKVIRYLNFKKYDRAFAMVVGTTKEYLEQLVDY